MDPTSLFSLFGLDLATVAMVCGIIYYVIEWVKVRFPTIFVGGWKTELLTFCLSFLIAFKVYYPSIESFVALGIICWLVPEGFHEWNKKRENNGS
jgi:hypothetical protein